MIPFRTLSIEKKLPLFIVGPATAALVTAAVLFLVFDWFAGRRELRSAVSTVVDIIAANSAAGVEFMDGEAITETLSSLRTRADVVQAWVASIDGEVLASYERAGLPVHDHAPDLEKPVEEFHGSHLHVSRRILHRGEPIGMVSVVADTTRLRERFGAYLQWMVILTTLCIAGAVLAGRALGGVVAEPILALARTARVVSTTSDFSMRAEESAGDDVGLLAREFNNMLGEIEARDDTLVHARNQLAATVTSLEHEVRKRTSVENALRASEDQLRHLAYHDGLTELPNRLMFFDHLDLALSERRRDRGNLAVMFLDLDRFKVVNDSLGHRHGDHVLKQVAARLISTLRQSDTIARIGGDEFLVLLPEMSHPSESGVVAQKVLESLKPPVHLAGREVVIGASIGIAVYPMDGLDSETLVRNADAAMYRAKSEGSGSYHLFTAELHEAAMKRMVVEAELRAAISGGQLRVFYQPIVSLSMSAVIGAEALVRWEHPERGIVGPDEFISIAEETGLIRQIGQLVVRTATAEVARWHELTGTKYRIAINLSALELEQEGFVAELSSIVMEQGLDPGLVDLEITERVAMGRDGSREKVELLRRAGFRVVIDDFGTGFSSLAYLKDFSFDGLKIDRRFLRDIEHDSRDQALTHAIIALATGLGIEVIAEGVETDGQRERLMDLGCVHAQGYLFCRPMPAEEFRELISGRWGETPRRAAAQRLLSLFRA